jgi:hypothetical protein
VKTNFHFVTHARTLEELRAEFLSDIDRRLQALGADKSPSTSTREKINHEVRYHINSIRDFWSQIEFAAPKRERKRRVPNEVKP